MIENDLWRRLGREVKNLFPLFRYLIFQTETHAFCLAVAAAALLGFFPSCLVMLAVLKNILKWDAAYDVMLDTIRRYLPTIDATDQEFVIRNLHAKLDDLGQGVGLTSLLWVLLGAAGVFIPLEAGLNRLWKVHEDRPYWLNQIVGFTLTVACTSLGLFFVSISTVFHHFVPYLPFQLVRTTTSLAIIRATTTCLFVITIFALYKFLPEQKINASQVLPAAILAGVMAELVRIVYVRMVPELAPTSGTISRSP